MLYLKLYLKILFASLFLLNLCFAQELRLTEEEKNWLSNHPIIHIAHDKNFPPYEWENDAGIYQGISIEYIQRIEKKLNIKFKQIKQKNWSKILQEFKDGKIDVLSAIAKDEKREKFTLFTKSHIKVQGIIVSVKEYKALNELVGERVGVVNDYYWDDLLSEYNDEVEIVRVSNTQVGIEMVAIGAIDAMVSDLASVTHIVYKESISGLQFVPVPILQEKKLELSIGIRKDWPLLQSIIQKALNDISSQEKEAIYKKWIKVQKVSFWQDTRFQYNVSILGLILLVIFLLIITWNRLLKSQVASRSKQLEKANLQLIRAEKMESIGRLSAGVAHEVKNPLAILQMSVDYLKGEDNDETTKTILDDMDDAIVRADRVIKGLLDFSREKELQVTKGNINDVIEQSLKLIEHEFKQRNIQLTTDLSETLPDLDMDRNRLQQVFINLFMNAAQAIGAASQTKNNAHIIVNSNLAQLEDQTLIEKSEGLFRLNQNVILISILDTGTGLDKKSEKEVFEPFFTTKPLGEGTGLGLSVSKTIIGLHHGMITMNNRSDIEITGVEVKLYFAVKGEKKQ